jgi:hypothetical protein
VPLDESRGFLAGLPRREDGMFQERLGRCGDRGRAEDQPERGEKRTDGTTFLHLVSFVADGLDGIRLIEITSPRLFNQPQQALVILGMALVSSGLVRRGQVS